MYYAYCPHCGKSNGDDDTILATDIVTYGYSEAEIIETRQCYYCLKEYKVRKNYKFNYEAIEG